LAIKRRKKSLKMAILQSGYQRKRRRAKEASDNNSQENPMSVGAQRGEGVEATFCERRRVSS